VCLCYLKWSQVRSKFAKSSSLFEKLTWKLEESKVYQISFFGLLQIKSMRRINLVVVPWIIRLFKNSRSLFEKNFLAARITNSLGIKANKTAKVFWRHKGIPVVVKWLDRLVYQFKKEKFTKKKKKPLHIDRKKIKKGNKKEPFCQPWIGSLRKT